MKFPVSTASNSRIKKRPCGPSSYSPLHGPVRSMMRLAGLRRAGAGSGGFYKESFGAKSVGMVGDLI